VIEPIDCKDVRLEGFAVTQNRMWSVHPTLCDVVVVSHLLIRATGGNGDGVDVDSCRHVRIEDCDIDAGDDAIAVKSGRGMEGYRQARPSDDVLVTRCVLGDANFAAFGIGSETSGGIRNIRVEHTRVTHAKTYAIYIKTRPGRGAFIENITVEDLSVEHAQGFLRLNLTNSGIQDPEPVPGDEGIPATRNFRFSDIRVAGGVLVDGASVPAEKPLDGLSIQRVTGVCAQGMTLANMKNVDLRDIAVTGVAGPLLTTGNVTGTGLAGAPPKRP
jgi:hypothetical protein